MTQKLQRLGLIFCKSRYFKHLSVTALYVGTVPTVFLRTVSVFHRFPPTGKPTKGAVCRCL